MKVSGTAVLHAPVEKVWEALNDPAVLVRTIPGCEQLEEVARDRYRMTITAGVASIKGSYVGDVALTEQQQPASFVLKASGSGAPGTVSADVTVGLTAGEDGTTQLRYDADAVVGGPVGGVGQRVLSGVAKKTAGEFFRAVDDVLTGKAPAPTAPPAMSEVGAPAAALTSDIARSGMWKAPAVGRGGTGGGSGDLLRAALLGAAIALAGVAVGGLLARRRT